MRVIKKILKYAALLVLLIALLDVGTILLVAHWRPEVKKSDAIIILGAAINTPALKNRTLTALDLYKQGKAPILVLSGGKRKESDLSEAEYMQKVLRAETQKRDDPPVILEQKATNTYENIQNSKALISDAKSVVIVSDEFHLARGVLLAYRAGFRHVSWASPKPTYYSKAELRRYYVREFFAMINYIPKLALNKN